MLNRPKVSGYGGDTDKYDDSNTIEECLDQIKNMANGDNMLY